MKRLLAALLAVPLLTACGNFRAIHYGESLSGNRALFVDAQQRALITTQRTQNGVRQQIVCSEASPDAMTVVAGSAAAHGQTDTFQAGLSLAMTQSGGSIGLRTHSIQILRDSLTQLCLNYMNGSLTQQEYRDSFQRYQQQLVGLVAIEQLTGVVQAPNMAFHAGATSAAAMRDQIAAAEAHLARIEAQRDALDGEITRLTPKANADGTMPPAPPELQRVTAQRNRLATDADEMRTTIREMYSRTNTASANAATSLGSTTVVNPPQNQRPNDITQVVAAVQSITELIISEGRCTGLTGENFAACKSAYARQISVSQQQTPASKTQGLPPPQ